MAEKIGLTEDGIKYHLNRLKKKSTLKRIGPDKGGALGGGVVSDAILDLLKVSSVVFSGVGAYFWIRRNVWNSPSWIADLARSKWGYNETTLRELSGQRADSLIAWIYIFLAMVAQATLFFIPQTWNSFAPFSIRHVFYLVIFSILLLLMGNYVSRKQEKRLIAKALTLLYLHKRDAVRGETLESHTPQNSSWNSSQEVESVPVLRL